MEKSQSPAQPLALPDLQPLAGKQTGSEVRHLVGLMQRLLAPDGCPWDREQTLATLIPYLVEETYEVVDAVESGDAAHHQEELGDLLLQVVFQAELRHAAGEFGIDDVARGIVSKLVRRHPHVFGEVKAETADQALASWARLKAEEKMARIDKARAAGEAGGGAHPVSALDGIPRSAPALLRASRAGEKASAAGFDWPDATGPRQKVQEELAELDEALSSGNRGRIAQEMGDTFFALVNLARKLGLDAESTLREATARFASRFAHLEQTLAAAGRSVRDASPEEQDRLWREAKEKEKDSERASG
jgi:MazG family protein